jgi:hypothetical protein
MPPLLLTLTLSSPLPSLRPPALIIITPTPLPIIVRIVALLAAESVFTACLARTRRSAFIIFIVPTTDILALAIAFSAALSFALACPLSFSLAPAVAVPAARFTRHASYLVLGGGRKWLVGGLVPCGGPILDVFDCSGEDRG